MFKIFSTKDLHNRTRGIKEKIVEKTLSQISKELENHLEILALGGNVIINFYPQLKKIPEHRIESLIVKELEKEGWEVTLDFYRKIMIITSSKDT